MRAFPYKISIVAISLLIFSCGDDPKPIYGNLGAFVEADTIRCVIEIPAGTNKKIEYRDGENDFKVDIRDGKERVVPFLPYPANYGFIPSTESKTAEGGDGDHLDIILLAESVETGTIIEAIPIAVLKLLDKGENDFKIICIPREVGKQIITAHSLEELRQDYPAIIEILNTWFTNYDKTDKLEILGWGDEQESLIEIKKNIVLNN